MKGGETHLLSTSLRELSIQAQELERKVTLLSQLDALKSKLSEKDDIIDKLKQKISQLETKTSNLEAKIANNQPTIVNSDIPIITGNYPENVINNLLDKLYLYVPDGQISSFSSEITRLLTINPGLANDETVIKVVQGSVIQDALVLIDTLGDETDCTELESQFSKFSNQKSLLANRLCLFLILKNMHLTNLYKILFTSLFYENFRSVATIKDALFAKMIDLQLLNDNSAFKHPILWAFGPNYSTKKALNYLQSLLFNVPKLPSDPSSGDNIWHYIARDKTEDIVTSIKNCNIHVDALEFSNKQGITPLHLAPLDTHCEISQCLIMNMASEGAEYYKSGDYDKALEYYSKALDKQISLSCEYTDILSAKDKSSHNTNIGKLLYNKARSLMHLRRWSESIATCELCITYLPRYGNAYETIIHAADSLLDWKRGLDTCNEYQTACGVDLSDKREFFNAQLNATAFQILQIPSNSTPKIIKQSFNNLCKLWHPDKMHENDDLKKRSTIHFNRLFNARQLLLDDETRLIEIGKFETNYIPPDPTFIKPRDDRKIAIDKITKLHLDVMIQTHNVGLLEMSGEKGEEIDKANLMLSNLQSKLLEFTSIGGIKVDDNYVERMRVMENLRNTHIGSTHAGSTKEDSIYRMESTFNDDENFSIPNFPTNFRAFQNFNDPSSSFIASSRYGMPAGVSKDTWKTSSFKDSWAGSGSRVRDFSTARIRGPSIARVSEPDHANNLSTSEVKNSKIPASKIRPLGFRLYSTSDS